MKASIISSVFQFGYILASLTLSNITDHVGRLPIFYIEQLGITVSLTLMMYFGTYPVCLACTALCGFFSFLPVCYTFAYDSNHSRYVGQIGRAHV